MRIPDSTRAAARIAAVGLVAVLLAGASECTYRGKPIGGGGSSSRDQLTQGPVTGFGSVFVGGVEFSTSSATITLDGASATEADLRPGYVVAVDGRLDSGSTTAGRASTIAGDAALVGTVSARDAAAGTITVLGTTVQLAGGTSYGAAIDGAATTPFELGDRVIVHGYSGATTAVLATRIERAASSRALQVAGRVTALDTAARRYTVRGTVVDWSNVGTAPSGLQNGAYAVATGTGTIDATTLRATQLAVRTEGAAASNGDKGDVVGVVSRYASATDFEVGGRTITTSSTTTYVNGAATDLTVGAVVTVAGTYDSSAKLVADRVEFQRAANFRMLGPIETFDTTRSSFLGGGVQVTTNSRTRWEDRSALGSRTLRYAELRSGDWVDVRGVEESTARNATAVVVERRNAPLDLRYELQGLAKITSNSAVVTLAGVAVTPADVAVFRDAAGATLTRTQFYQRAPDKPVVARGRFSGATLVADSLQLRP